MFCSVRGALGLLVAREGQNGAGSGGAETLAPKPHRCQPELGMERGGRGQRVGSSLALTPVLALGEQIQLGHGETSSLFPPWGN